MGLVFSGGGPGSIDHVGLFVGVVGGRDVMVEEYRPRRDRRLELPFALKVPAQTYVFGFLRPLKG